MAHKYAIHPSIGVARVGNSIEFYLAPDAIGGLPFQCDQHGNALLNNGQTVTVKQFKDVSGCIRRQGASFKVFRYDDADPDAEPVAVTLAAAGVKSLAWTVHVANKKAAWYHFSELRGDTMLGADNTYKNNNIPLRNKDNPDRQSLVIDPGPRTLIGPRQHVNFDRHSMPPAYTHGHFPKPNPSEGHSIDTLGSAITDDSGGLVVLAAFGRAGGDQSITSFAGADNWHDDVADGSVTCRLTLEDGATVELNAWVVTGSPKFAPELVNIVTLDDIAFDVSVRYQNLLPDMYANGAYNPEYVVSYHDIEPIIRRPLDYIWVANVPSMVAFAAPPFNSRDHSAESQAFREEYFSFFRLPGTPVLPKLTGATGQINQLWSDPLTQDGVPLMPMNSGSNSVSNEIIDKFLTLTETQYFMLGQWASGKFTTDKPKPIPGVHDLDRASIGNCVGAPMCPGIEVTWSTRNPKLYAQPYRIQQRHDEAWYYQHGLDPMADETEGGGCEPGDLTKRMAIPWQADFFDCTVQFVNFSDPTVNKTGGIPEPPTYYSYWWPAQTPMYVMTGATTAAGEKVEGVPADLQLYYPRGINSFTEMITAWSYLGFILNQNSGPARSRYPYFAEAERNNDQFVVTNVAVAGVGNFNTDDQSFYPIWHLKSESIQLAGPGVRPLRQRRR